MVRKATSSKGRSGGAGAGRKTAKSAPPKKVARSAKTKPKAKKTPKRAVKKAAKRKTTATAGSKVRSTAKKSSKKSAKKSAKKSTKKSAKKRAGKAKAKKTPKHSTAPERPKARTASGTAPRTATTKRPGAATSGGRRKSKRPSAGRSPIRAGAAAARSPSSLDPIQFPELPRKMPKTYLTKRQLEQFKELLLKKRHELAGDVKHLAHQAFDKGRGAGEHSAMPIHMADLGSDNWEHEFTLGLIENEQGRIRMIDEALARIPKKTYGVCLATHKKISLARLRAKPWARYCIEYARAREEGRVR